MKVLNLILISFLLFSCAKNEERTINPKTIQNQGGVDVGNMSSVVGIPGTHAVLTIPEGWQAVTESNILTITNTGSSTIKALRSEITELVAPTQTALINYLKNKYPARTYDLIEINGLKGVRADVEISDHKKVSDIYLISELNDFIHMMSNLEIAGSGLIQGEKIIQTVQLKYYGEEIKDSEPKTVRLQGHNRHYSLIEECFSADESDATTCESQGISFDGKWMQVGNGRIVELGSGEEVPFDAVRIEGEYLVSPQTKIPISDIYSTFSAKNQSAEKGTLKVKTGYTYLVRTMDWPRHDIITKVTINTLLTDYVSITYQKLVAVNQVDLQKQVDAIIKNTKENEMHIENGEVTLFNPLLSKNEEYGSFNFQYSNSGNKYLIGSDWDFMFFWPTGRGPTLKVSFLERENVGGIVPFEVEDLSKITKADFPKPFEGNNVEIKAGKTYGIFNHKTGVHASSVYGAIKVLEIDQEQRWVRLKFRRIYVGKPERIQNWKVPSYVGAKFAGNFSCSLTNGKVSDNDPHHFCEESYVNHDSLKGSLKMKFPLYPGEAGFYNFGKNLKIEQISISDVENQLGNFKQVERISEGDVIAVYNQDFKYKSVFLVKIEKYIEGQILNYSVKDLGYFVANYWSEYDYLYGYKYDSFKSIPPQEKHQVAAVAKSEDDADVPEISEEGRREWAEAQADIEAQKLSYGSIEPIVLTKEKAKINSGGYIFAIELSSQGDKIKYDAGFVGAVALGKDYKSFGEINEKDIFFVPTIKDSSFTIEKGAYFAWIIGEASGFAAGSKYAVVIKIEDYNAGKSVTFSYNVIMALQDYVY